MCDFSGKLVAWLDQELPAEEAANVERHLKDCSECRSDADAYKRVSAELDAYCDAAIAARAPSPASRWVLVASGAAAAAALVALLLAMSRAQVKSPALSPPKATIAVSHAADDKALPASVKPIPKIHRRQDISPASVGNASPASAQTQNDYVLADEPVIQFAIPADEMFPPGAVPEGVHFVADVTIGADGSTEGLRLHPRLAGFERRTTEP